MTFITTTNRKLQTKTQTRNTLPFTLEISAPPRQIPLRQELVHPNRSKNHSFDQPDMSIADVDRLMAADHDTTSSQNPSPGPSTRNGLRQPNHSSQTSRKPHGPHGGWGGYGGHGGNGGRGG